eukprot:GHVN01101173.1.p1 GENE.GHVN01101173.1~~GHVN01101173.1.p1  ORF type:complete len:141 (-),score=8.00 GHVN01101173.1:230-652(-)
MVFFDVFPAYRFQTSSRLAEDFRHDEGEGEIIWAHDDQHPWRIPLRFKRIQTIPSAPSYSSVLLVENIKYVRLCSCWKRGQVFPKYCSWRFGHASGLNIPPSNNHTTEMLHDCLKCAPATQQCLMRRYPRLQRGEHENLH